MTQSYQYREPERSRVSCCPLNYKVVCMFILIFSGTVILSGFVSIYAANQHAKAYGDSALTELERSIDNISQELRVLYSTISPQCSDYDKFKLRLQGYESKMIQEVKAYSRNHFFCSSYEGRIDDRMSRHTLDVIERSTHATSIVLTTSELMSSQLTIFASTGKGRGYSATIHPNQFLSDVSNTLTNEQYHYEVRVGTQAIPSSQPLFENPDTELYFASHRYPISLRIQLGDAAYQTYFINHIWHTSLFACLFACLYLIYHQNRRSKSSIEFALREAIHEHQIKVHLQPIIDIYSQTVVGSEALNRWYHPKQGYISPDVFVPLAERLGLINELTQNTFAMITRILNQNKAELAHQYISVNLSRQLITQPEFIEFLLDYADKNASIVAQILLEITEDHNLDAQELEVAIASLSRLKEKGFRIAIDDFGTGYSGLDFIRQHTFNVMKIDKVFINGLRKNEAIAPVLVSMIELARELDMTVIAEGAETQEQITQLRQLGVQYVQGFYYSRAIPPKDFVSFGQQPFVGQLIC